MRANLSDTYTYGGKFYGPGADVEIPPEMAASLRQRGVLPPADEDDSGDVLSSLPPGAVAGYFVPGDSISGAGSTRLGTGLVARPRPIVTPGDPVQRAAAVPQPIEAAMIGRESADPAAGLPPPVVHTSEGEAIDPAEAEDGAEDDGDDDGEDGDEDPEADETEGAEATATETPPETATARPRPPRVTSRPRTPAAGQ